MLKYSDCVQNRELLLEYIGVSKWKYKDDMVYWLSFYNQNEYIKLHKDDETDLASSPCFAQCIIPKERFLISCIHDEIYSPRTTYVYVKDRTNLSLRMQELQRHWEWIDDNTFLPNKDFADLVFFYWMQEENLVFYDTKSIKPYFGYLAVKWFGRSHYKYKKSLQY